MNPSGITETSEALPKVVVVPLDGAPQVPQVREMDSTSSSSLQKSNRDNSKKRRPLRATGEFDVIKERLVSIYPPFDLAPVRYDAKFLGRYRLYVSNLGSISKEDLEVVFKEYGDVSDVFVQADKNFGFVRMDHFFNAVKAKLCLHGTQLKGKKMFVAFSPHASVLVRNLSPSVTNEFLHLAFSIFGDIESATVLTDKRGKLIGEGVVDFVKKGSAMAARKYCAEKVFLLTSSFKPVVVEEYSYHTMPHDTDGFSEETVRKSADFYEDRNVGPRFAPVGTVEFDYGKRFLELWKAQRERKDMLRIQQEEEEIKLVMLLKEERYDEETSRLKEMIRQREMQSKGFYRPFGFQGKKDESSDRKYPKRDRDAQESWWMSDTPKKSE